MSCPQCRFYCGLSYEPLPPAKPVADYVALLDEASKPPAPIEAPRELTVTEALDAATTVLLGLSPGDRWLAVEMLRRMGR